MKKLIVFIAALILSANVFAQDYKSSQSTTTTQTEQDKMKKDGLIMKGGKVYDMREGKNVLVTSDVNLAGTTVSPDGMVTLNDGTKTALKDGDGINADGLVQRASEKGKEKMPDDKMENK